ncbi:MAG: hypothetical protein QOE64_1532, partial [Frankiales bacterium]|nr:hypothetical protein [Frankiales bacterium]
DRADQALGLHPRATSVELRVEVAMWRARVRLRTGVYSQGLRMLTTAERLAAHLPESAADRLRAEVLAQRAFVRHMQGREQEALRWARRAVAVAEAARATAALAQALQVLDWACVGLGRFDEEPYAERALQLWEEVGDLGWQARVLVHLGIRSYYTGHWTAALEHYSRAQQVFERSGDMWGASVCAGNTAEIYVEQGRLSEALAPTRLALRAAKVAGARSFIALWTAQLGRIAIREGRSEEGMALLREARDIYEADGEAASALVVEAQLASGLAISGQAAEAVAAARTMLEQLGQVPGAAEAEALAHRARGFALLDLGLPEEAVAAFRESLASARKRTARRDITLALDALIAHCPATPDEISAWRAERDELVRNLGIELLGVRGTKLRLVVPEQSGSSEGVLAG